MIFKTNVPQDTLRIELRRLLPVIDFINRTVAGREVIITSTTDGNHMKGSLHYQGLAVDIRTRDLSGLTKSILGLQLKLALNLLCDVVVESDHIHIEYQPIG